MAPGYPWLMNDPNQSKPGHCKALLPHVGFHAFRMVHIVNHPEVCSWMACVVAVRVHVVVPPVFARE